MRNSFPSFALLVLSFTALHSGSAQIHPWVVPSGTNIRVRTTDPIDVQSVQPGWRYRGVLVDPLKNSAGMVLIPSGTPAKVKVVRVKKSTRISGRDKIYLQVDGFVYKGKAYALVTTIAESRGKGKGKRALEGAGIGAGAGGLIGGLAGGGAGFAAGALLGGATGTGAAAATGGEHLTIPAETVLTFQLSSPLTVK
jgi:hypothetical protein